jgi:prepilin-type N-terminal cleavage/methylation domain-containing protein
MDGVRSRFTGGFSLLELILAMLIMATLLAVVAPNLRGFTASRQTQNTAAAMVALTRWARLQAAAEGRPYRLNVDIDTGEYWLTAQDGANFEELGTSLGQRFLVPDGVTLEWKDSPIAEDEGYLSFDPGGHAEPATLRLTGKLGTIMDVTCPAPTEPFRVEARPEEEYRL